jgi:hypothetical protein
LQTLVLPAKDDRSQMEPFVHLAALLAAAIENLIGYMNRSFFHIGCFRFAQKALMLQVE